MDSNIFGIDQFIGEPDLIGKGLGPKIIAEFIRKLSEDNQVQEVIADPDPSNLRAIKTYEKIGFISSGITSTPNGKAMLMRFTVRR